MLQQAVRQTGMRTHAEDALFLYKSIKHKPCKTFTMKVVCIELAKNAAYVLPNPFAQSVGRMIAEQHKLHLSLQQIVEDVPLQGGLQMLQAVHASDTKRYFHGIMIGFLQRKAKNRIIPNIALPDFCNRY